VVAFRPLRVAAAVVVVFSQPFRDIHEIQLPKEGGVFLRREGFRETVSRHLRRRQPFDCYRPILHLLAQLMLMDINMAQPSLQLNRLFCGYIDCLEVVAVDLRCLLGVELDIRKETSPPNDFPCRR
jgi:hypothetical protein